MKAITDYQKFIELKSQLGSGEGFDPLWMPSFLYDFQEHLVHWALRRGKAAIFADCGMGKTPMQLVWAENVIRKTNKPVLIITPLAVSAQTVREAEKFKIDCRQSREGQVHPNITVTNYERIHYFDPDAFSGVVLDESSAIKHFTGARQRGITQFMRKTPYRLLCTATAAPNDYIELGTSSEALGQLGRMDMLSMFFINEENTMHRTWGIHLNWRFKKHAERNFWRWVCSWARAIRKPSDLGYSDEKFVLPKLTVTETIVKNTYFPDGMLFQLPAITLDEQRAERKNTVKERCEEVAKRVVGDRPVVIWCHLNSEADLLAEICPDAKQVKGSDEDERKEELFMAFASGELRVLVTKPKIGAFGLNWQHCSHMTMFPSHSFEQYYQAVRRCWRFGQTRPVQVDIITTEGEMGVVRNMERKERAADKMFSAIVAEMNNVLKIQRSNEMKMKMEVPKWQ